MVDTFDVLDSLGAFAMRLQALLSACILSFTLVSGAAIEDVPVETQSLDELYQLALAEGGGLIVSAGGDEKDQQDAVVAAFKERFPGININTTVDLSKVSL